MRHKKKRASDVRYERWLLGIVMTFLLALGTVGLWFTVIEDSGPTVLGAGTDLRTPIAELEEGELHLFSYPIDSSRGVEFIVQRGQDGILRVSFASCRRCSRFRHYERWGQLICGHCGHATPLPDPGDIPTNETGCIPVALPYSVEGNQLEVHGETIREEFKRWYGQVGQD